MDQLTSLGTCTLVRRSRRRVGPASRGSFVSKLGRSWIHVYTLFVTLSSNVIKLDNNDILFHLVLTLKNIVLKTNQ